MTVVALILAVLAVVAAWSVALRMHRFERAAVKACLLLHDRLHNAEAALAGHIRHDAAVKAMVVGAALANATRH